MRPRAFLTSLLGAPAPLLACAVLLASCSEEPGDPQPADTAIPDELAKSLKTAPPAVVRGEGTPLESRVATLGLLNKRNNISRDIVLKPGEAKRLDNVLVKLASCERTAIWESPQETGAFVQVLVQERATVDDPLRWRRVFSGWLFKNSPSLNVVEHPIYDVWVKDCAMKYPGEEAAAAASAPAAPARATAPAASPSPPASPAPEPAPAPAADSNAE